MKIKDVEGGDRWALKTDLLLRDFPGASEQVLRCFSKDFLAFFLKGFEWHQNIIYKTLSLSTPVIRESSTVTAVQAVGFDFQVIHQVVRPVDGRETEHQERFSTFLESLHISDNDFMDSRDDPSHSVLFRAQI